MSFDVKKFRQDFPILQQENLVFLDNAATTQKPHAVISATQEFYRSENANVHRGVYALSEKATAHYEKVRSQVKDTIHAKSEKEIIFVKGTTEAINLVAYSFGESECVAGDEIIISAMEHHANIVPWQLLCQKKGLKLRVIPMDEQGELKLDAYPALFNSKTKLVAITHISNALGTINPIKAMIKLAHEHNVPVLIDAAQSIAHGKIDVQDLDCDFMAFSSHKMYGPTGVGVLYGKESWLDKVPPYQGGGDMIKSVSFEKTEFADLPLKFEAGTPNIAGVIGLGAALDYLNALDLDQVAQYEQELLRYASKQLKSIPGLRIIGEAKHKAPVISFSLANIHPHDIGSIVAHEGVCVRAGHHCAMPVMQFFNVAATTRASFSFYNTTDEIDALIAALYRVKELFER